MCQVLDYSLAKMQLREVKLRLNDLPTMTVSGVRHGLESHLSGAPQPSASTKSFLRPWVSCCAVSDGLHTFPGSAAH